MQNVVGAENTKPLKTFELSGKCVSPIGNVGKVRFENPMFNVVNIGV